MRIVLSALVFLFASNDSFCQEYTPNHKENLYDCTVYTSKSDKDYCEYQNAKFAAVNQETNLRTEEFKDSPNCDIGEFWKSSMGSDPMTDEKSCSISPAVRSKEEGGLFTLINRTGVHFTTIGDKYPGQSSRIRIDKNQAFAFEESISGERAKKLLLQINNGTMILTKYMGWPYNLPHLRSVPICDLPKKIQSCRNFVK